MNIYTIYRATNLLNGKVYIGYTGNYCRRVRDHCSRYKTRDSILYRALRKYGVDNFVWEAIYQSVYKDHTLVMEKHFIKEYNSFRFGYNMTLGGEGSATYNENYTFIHEEER